MASATLLKSSFLPKKAEWGATRQAAAPKPMTVSMVVRASAYADELVKTAKTIASPGRGILAMDESNATCGKRLASIGLENTEANRQAYRTLLVTPPGLGNYISGAILFEETLYQSTVDGKKIVDILVEQGIVPGIKVDKGLVPLVGSNDESWCQGLDGLASREAAYYQQGARFAKWRTVVSIPNGHLSLLSRKLPGSCPLRGHLTGQWAGGRLWSLRSCSTVSTASRGPSRWRRRCGRRPFTTCPEQRHV
ncbi:chloroplast fructose-1,6-biphosphate aldolase [Hordeum vulgare]|nr:chloroplast fructose-1,6-biphosphate aldolase [Hordeum vulgare]